MSSQQAMELAYGLLWIVGCDRSTANGNALYLARKALYERISKDGQARGITAARAAITDNPFHNLPDPVDTGIFPRTNSRLGDVSIGDATSNRAAAVHDDGDTARAAHETGLTPRQLAERCKELEAVLRYIARTWPDSSAAKHARAALAKATASKLTDDEIVELTSREAALGPDKAGGA